MDEVDFTAQSYRMNMIESIQKELEMEREKRTVLIEKYHKGCTVIDGIQHGLVIGMIGFGATSLGAITTVVGTPLAIAMDIGAVTAGILSIASNRIWKYLKTKMNKHEKIRSLAETKLCIISEYISKAIEDNEISEEEYSLILAEYKDFNTKKDELRMKTKQAIEEQNASDSCTYTKNDRYNTI